MALPFRYVRRKDAPLTIKMAGFCDFTGQFDTSQYEMIQAPLPEGAQIEATQSLSQVLTGALKQATVGNRAAFYAHFAAIEAALRADDVAAARAILQGLSALPVGVEAVRQALLTRLP